VVYIFRKTRAITIIRKATRYIQNMFTSLGNIVKLMEITRGEIKVLSILSRIKIKVQRINKIQS
jgi:hypothetical protein